MGLPIAKAIVEVQHGGSIGVISQVGHGSVFTFSLPILRGTTGTKMSTPTILVVDDEPQIRRVMCGRCCQRATDIWCSKREAGRKRSELMRKERL